MRKGLFVLFLLIGLCVGQPPQTYVIGGLFEMSGGQTSTELLQSPSRLRSMSTGFRLAIESINDNPLLLPNTTLVPQILDTQGTIAGALSGLVKGQEDGLRAVVGPGQSDQCVITAVAGGVYDMLIASPSASSNQLSSVQLYPLFIRGIAPSFNQSNVMADLIDYYAHVTGEERWRETSVISTADDYGVEGSKSYIAHAEERGIQTLAFQQFLVGSTNVEVEVRELVDSDARVFIAYLRGPDYQTMIKEAHNQGIIGKYYVWICSDGCSTIETFIDQDNRDPLPAIAQLSLGYQGVIPQGGQGPLFEEFLEKWHSLDPHVYPGAGPERDPSLYVLLTYEITICVAHAIHERFEMGNFAPNGTELYQSSLGTTFEGLTGPFALLPNGDRLSSYEVVNYWPDYSFRQTFVWNSNSLDMEQTLENTKLFSDNLSPIVKTRWRDGTNNIPDLDVRTPFDYWSCHDKESGNDETGKTISIKTPDGRDVNYIKGSYQCDQFIDCRNVSDEGYQCTPSYTVVFLVLGVITGLLILIACCFIPFICVFGCFVKRHRIFLSGTLFLLLLCVSSVIGFFSTYAWYGKPQSFACTAQLWLFGISSAMLIGALFAKQIRIFRSSTATFWYRKLAKSEEKGLSAPIHPEIEYCIYFILLMIVPIFMICLWTLSATPMGRMMEIDDEDHYLCDSGGLTGPPVGLVYFYIIVAYLAAQLVLCLCLSFLNRHVPRPFMDKRLMSISVFNLGFLMAVVIPLFQVLQFISPFISWVIRDIAVLYAFGSTLFLHMVPKVFGLVLFDRFKDNVGGKGGKGAPKMRPPGATTADTMSASNSVS